MRMIAQFDPEFFAPVLQALAGTPLPTILLLGGMFFLLLAVSESIGGYISLSKNAKKLSSMFGLGLVMMSVVLYSNASEVTPLEPAPENTSPSVSAATVEPEPNQSEPSPQMQISLSSPERSLGEYARSLTDRNFATLKKIYPKTNEAKAKEWLEGKDNKASIELIQLVGQPQRITASENEVVLRAKMQYCRQDNSGSTDIKNYTFIKVDGLWKLDTNSAPEEVTRISC